MSDFSLRVASSSQYRKMITPCLSTVASKVDAEMLPVYLTGLAESLFDTFQSRLVSIFPEAVLGAANAESKKVFIECDRAFSIKKKERVSRHGTRRSKITKFLILVAYPRAPLSSDDSQGDRVPRRGLRERS